MWSRDCVQLTVLSVCSYSRRNACIQRLSVVSGISWRESCMVMTAAGSREGCFQVHCIRLLSHFFSIHFPQLSKEQGAHTLTGTHTHSFHRNVTYFIINRLWIVISRHRAFSREWSTNIKIYLFNGFSQATIKMHFNFITSQ